jgi:GH24 family phage-related lysozyme (muramidase)
MAWLGGFKGDSYNREQFKAWLKTQKKPSFVSFIAVHATGAPYTVASIGGAKRMTSGLRDYYQRKLGWKGGPHFFAMGDGRVYPGTPVHLPSVHSPSWNNIAIAVEAEGDYRKGRMSWEKGDGKIVWTTMAWVFAELLEWLGLEANDKHIRFHREDSRTSHRECPGAMDKAWFIDQVRTAWGKAITLVNHIKPVVASAMTITPKQEVVYQPGTCKYSDYCVSVLKKVEGLRLKAYYDKPGWAIGYGHNSTGKIAPIPHEGMTLKDEAEAHKILLGDMDDKLRYINTWVKVPLTQGNVDALILFIFQQGPTSFKTKLLSLVNSKMHWSVARYLDDYKHANAGVVRRRKFEAEIYRGKQPTKW